jgi:hypothetical protein
LAIADFGIADYSEIANWPGLGRRTGDVSALKPPDAYNSQFPNNLQPPITNSPINQPIPN